MRSSCLECVMKHVSTAMVYMQEAKLGYPHHKFYAIGELVHAEYEILDRDQGIANVLRVYRRQYFDTDIYPFEEVITLLCEEFANEPASSSICGREQSVLLHQEEVQGSEAEL